MKKMMYTLLLATLAGCTSSTKTEDGKSPVRDAASLKSKGADSAKAVKTNSGNADPSGHIKNQ